MANEDYNLKHLNFLLVEDNLNMRNLVSGVLIALGVERTNLKMAADGADGLKELRLFAPDIIICDWVMDPLDGIDFTRMVRTGTDSINPYVPIIMLTGHTEMNRVAEARDAGVSEYLAKPISAKSLFSRIRTIIDRPRSFVRTSGMNGYFGPDRRRRVDPSYRGLQRRQDTD